MSSMEVITSISEVLIPECIMLCEATQRMLDLKLVYWVIGSGGQVTGSGSEVRGRVSGDWVWVR